MTDHFTLGPVRRVLGNEPTPREIAIARGLALDPCTRCLLMNCRELSDPPLLTCSCGWPTVQPANFLEQPH